jgi:hypothetical protein
VERDDFELHRALEDIAPAAVRTLLELADKPGLSKRMRVEALARLRQIQGAGLVDGLEPERRARVTRILERS